MYFSKEQDNVANKLSFKNKIPLKIEYKQVKTILFLHSTVAV